MQRTLLWIMSPWETSRAAVDTPMRRPWSCRLTTSTRTRSPTWNTSCTAHQHVVRLRGSKQAAGSCLRLQAAIRQSQKGGAGVDSESALPVEHRGTHVGVVDMRARDAGHVQQAVHRRIVWPDEGAKVQDARHLAPDHAAQLRTGAKASDRAGCACSQSQHGRAAAGCSIARRTLSARAAACSHACSMQDCSCQDPGQQGSVHATEAAPCGKMLCACLSACKRGQGSC